MARDTEHEWTIEVGVSTMDEVDPCAVRDRLGLATRDGVRLLVINQCPTGPLPPDVTAGPVRMYSFRERGVSRSRNRAIALCKAELLLFGDDDLCYVADFAAYLRAAFDHYPQATAITFPILDLSTGQPKRRFPARARVHSSLSIAGVGTPEIAVQVGRLGQVRFDLGFGLGSACPQGDEPIFLRDLQREGRQVAFWPRALCGYHGQSSGSGAWPVAMVHTKRAVLRRMYPQLWPVMATAMAVSKYPRHGRDVPAATWARAWLGQRTTVADVVASSSADAERSSTAPAVALPACGPAQPGLVSIYIPTRGRAALVSRAVDSALAQTVPVEVLVVSDGPDAQTAAVMAQRYADEPRVRYLSLTEPRGACAARNHALRHARGQYVTGLDDDDRFAPAHVSGLLAAYRPTLGLVAASQCIHYPGRTVPYVVDAGLIELDGLLHYNKVGNHAFIERDRLLAVGGFDEALPAFQDYDLWVRLVARYGPARKLPVASYHLHIDHGFARISDVRARRQRALSIFLSKHRHLMSASHLRSMALLAHKHSGEALSLAQALNLIQRGNEKAVLSLWVNTRMPWVQRAYHQWLTVARGAPK